ncbi:MULTISPECIES: response regulator transcription factor [unclassified Variovorax]|uniref:LuxR C-terminal-related transcriptional regulator n=1 Tax=unclassified Variovorax TaxID=663243 RepID=UPI00076CCCDB|nr:MULTISPECIES: response regulator transcription factor [unclassified Variovorax]KWT94135.1 two component transcriptional regulator, LuxR family [Variovorax sp. WDL1]PNG59906.1 Transcriptional regulatory protein DegU [Variovorax sp. B4]PNG60303.1 Transcriptional regulatory protein DegU [Variovorax sp. B2]VTV13850.1 Protease production enhancer protein [Variovorax sp. WDL1]
MNNASRPISVRICHGEPLLAAGLLSLIEQAPGIEPRSFDDDGDGPADVIIADLANGLALLESKAATHAGPRVIVVTRRAREGELLHALERGAHGCLMQTSDAQELVDAIRHVARGGARYLCRDASALVAGSEPPPAKLTARESEVLRLLVRGDCNKGIARQLQISTHTVKAHVSMLCNKLHAMSRTQVAIKATGRGLVQAPAPALPAR